MTQISTPSRPRRGLRTLASALLVAGVTALAGCASTFTTKVSNFNQWPANAAGASFAVQPATGEGVALGELERKTYEGYLAQNLQKQAMVQAATPAQARMQADMAVNVKRELRQFSVPVYRHIPWGGFGTWPYYPGAAWNGPWNPGDYYEDGAFGMGGMMPMYLGEQIVTRPVHYYQLRVRIADRAQALKGQPAPRVFESTAEYVGNPVELPSVMPYLMESVFDRFPGTNGQVRTIEFDSDTGAKVVPKP